MVLSEVIGFTCKLDEAGARRIQRPWHHDVQVEVPEEALKGSRPSEEQGIEAEAVCESSEGR